MRIFGFLCLLTLSGCFLNTNNSFSGDEALLTGGAYKLSLSTNHCFTCHTPWSSLSTQEEWLAAVGDEIVPGDANASDFYRRVTGASGVNSMPPSGSLMSADEAALIADWINAMTP